MMQRPETMSVPLYKAHPWHGINPCIDDTFYTAYIEIVPQDTVKFELDKASGFLSLDRPHKFSSIIPSLYGFIPRTYSHTKSAARALAKLPADHAPIDGDKDPLDVCVLTEKSIPHGDFLLKCRPVGGFLMIDTGEVDDKIVAVLKDDSVYGHITTLSELPSGVVDRLRHYFLTYKDLPGRGERKISIPVTYEAAEAYAVIRDGMSDYTDKFRLHTDFGTQHAH